MASIIWFGLGLLTGIFVSQNYGDQVPDAKEMVQKVLSEVRPRPPNDELRMRGWEDERAASLLARTCIPAPPTLFPLPSHPHSSLHIATRTAARHARRAVEQRVPTPARTLTHPFHPLSFPTTIDSYLRAFASSLTPTRFPSYPTRATSRDEHDRNDPSHKERHHSVHPFAPDADPLTCHCNAKRVRGIGGGHTHEQHWQHPWRHGLCPPERHPHSLSRHYKEQKGKQRIDCWLDPPFLVAISDLSIDVKSKHDNTVCASTASTAGPQQHYAVNATALDGRSALCI